MNLKSHLTQGVCTFNPVTCHMHDSLKYTSGELSVWAWKKKEKQLIVDIMRVINNTEYLSGCC